MIKDFIEELRQKEIEITFSAGKLKYSGPEEHITTEFIEKLKKNKGKLIKHFWPNEFSLMMPINTDGTKTPLFIVHGDYSNYVLSDHLGPDQPVYGFFHPGSEGEAIRFKGVEEMAETYLKQVLGVFPSGPFYLMGFSFGGTLAYEMAVQLQKAGHKVPFLVFLDSLSPLARIPVKTYSNMFTRIRKTYLAPLKRKWGQFVKLAVCNSYILTNRPIPLDKRADYIYLKYLKLTMNYSPSKFDGDVMLFRTSENPSSDKYLGWETFVNNVKLIEIEGKHLEIFINKNNTRIVKTEIEKYLKFVNGLN